MALSLRMRRRGLDGGDLARSGDRLARRDGPAYGRRDLLRVVGLGALIAYRRSASTWGSGGARAVWRPPPPNGGRLLRPLLPDP